MDRLRAGEGAGRDQSKLTRALHVGDGLEVLLRAISPEAAFSRVSISTEVKDMNIHTSRATSFLGSQSVSQLFHGPAPRRSPLLRKLSSSKGWGCKCTRVLPWAGVADGDAVSLFALRLLGRDCRVSGNQDIRSGGGERVMGRGDHCWPNPN